MSRRNTELLLLCLAAPFVVLLFAMVLVQQGTALSLESLTAPLGLFAAFVVAHIATRFLAKNADPAILPITFGLSGIGIAFVTRLAPDLAVSQIIWLFVGIATIRSRSRSCATSTASHNTNIRSWYWASFCCSPP